nr:MAG TPA: hypothetical protein [Caudoviricetes sp.]
MNTNNDIITLWCEVAAKKKPPLTLENKRR